MDKLLGKAVEMFGDNDERPQGGNAAHGGSYPAGGGFPQAGDDDLRGAASAAASHAPEDEDFFSNALGKLLQNKSVSQVGEEDIDEEDAVRSHRQFFGSDSSSQNQQQASSSTLGNAAALQALKLFTSGNQGGGGGQSQNALVGLAMAQASKLFDAQASQGNVAAGADKQSAVMKAGEMALKMYLKSQGGSGGGQGGLGGLMGLAGKFL